MIKRQTPSMVYVNSVGPLYNTVKSPEFKREGGGGVCL
jgi:hypothetical protein